MSACCNGVQFAVVVLQAFDGGQRRAVGLHSEHGAGADGLAVDQDGAGAADAVLAAEVGAGEAAVLAERVGEGAAGLEVGPDAVAVDAESDVHWVSP